MQRACFFPHHPWCSCRRGGPEAFLVMVGTAGSQAQECQGFSEAQDFQHCQEAPPGFSAPKTNYTRSAGS